MFKAIKFSVENKISGNYPSQNDASIPYSAGICIQASI